MKIDYQKPVKQNGKKYLKGKQFIMQISTIKKSPQNYPKLQEIKKKEENKKRKSCYAV